jgi:hypothetical protein
MKNKTKLIFETIFTILILISFIGASGIVSPYWKDYPLEMNFGETKVANFVLQNMVGTEDITVKAELKRGTDIASLEKDTYTARAGTSDTIIPVKIIIPKDYDKSLQQIQLEVKTVETGQGGMITLGTGWTTSFNVIISEKPISKEFLIGIIMAMIIVLIILVLIILILVLRKRTK